MMQHRNRGRNGKQVVKRTDVVESLSDIETSILIELQSIANIPFSKKT